VRIPAAVVEPQGVEVVDVDLALLAVEMGVGADVVVAVVQTRLPAA
jgi:hypothetical protein